MGIIEWVVFSIITLLPVVALISAITLLIIGFFLKYKGKPCKKFIIIGIICLAIPIVYCLIFFIIGIVGFGPGMVG